MRKLYLCLCLLFSNQIFSYELQLADLKTSIERHQDQFELYDFYTYLKTAPINYEGENVFEALTFRGDGIKLFLAKDENALKAKIEEQEILISYIEPRLEQLPNGINSITAYSKVKVQLKSASLGRPYKIKVPLCLPGFPCTTKTIKVIPHQYMITIIGETGDAFCIKRGFNSTAENHGKVNDQYLLGECR